jgi:hypothetical protein
MASGLAMEQGVAGRLLSVRESVHEEGRRRRKVLRNPRRVQI